MIYSKCIQIYSGGRPRPLELRACLSTGEDVRLKKSSNLPNKSKNSRTPYGRKMSHDATFDSFPPRLGRGDVEYRRLGFGGKRLFEDTERLRDLGQGLLTLECCAIFEHLGGDE